VVWQNGETIVRDTAQRGIGATAERQQDSDENYAMAQDIDLASQSYILRQACVQKAQD
jgi:hypothetical protein